jgi:hypothetical protein
MTLLNQLICEEAIAEGGIAAVSINESIGQVGVLIVTMRDGAPCPSVITLRRELENPTSQPDGESVIGQFPD